MPLSSLPASALRLTIDPDSLGFSDTGELPPGTVPWIGQERAHTAAQFGLAMDQPGYNLFVLGEVGSGRSSLLLRAMRAQAVLRPVPPDLCYLYNFDAPERPRALRLPAGQGRQLRQRMARLCKTLETEVPLRLDGDEYRAESERLGKAHAAQEGKIYAELAAFAEQRNFNLHRDEGHLVFTLRGADGHALTEKEAAEMPRERRTQIEQAEVELRAEINRFLDLTRPLERALDEALQALRRQVVKPMLALELQTIKEGLEKSLRDNLQLALYLDQVGADVLENTELFQELEDGDDARQEALEAVLARYRVNLLVDNAGLTGAPVMVEDNPLFRLLFGSIEYQSDEEVLVTDFSRIRAGSLLRAHGGFLLLHLRDLLGDPVVWEKLRRFLRSGRVQIEEPSTAYAPMAAVSLEPEAVDVDVKLVLIGSVEQYYELQEADPEFARHFRVKVDFADSFMGSAQTRQATAAFVAQCCASRGLPPASAAAVARLIEETHRDADDQSRQCAAFGRTQALVLESAAVCRARAGLRVELPDVCAALLARQQRHDYPERRMRESITDGERVILLRGAAVGQINGLTQVDLGDYRFGFPVRLSARCFAGQLGVFNIEREVEMSGPIHDKGVLILHGHLSALFARLAPLAMTASFVMEQEYHGVEGDSASCAELYALLSALADAPLSQSLAVTGALNQHGEVLPVGGINEKIEGYFRICAQAGLDGSHGVLIPERNRHHLMLDPDVIAAVAAGQFQIRTMAWVGEGLELMTGLAYGVADSVTGDYPPESLLGRAATQLRAYRRACQRAARR